MIDERELRFNEIRQGYNEDWTENKITGMYDFYFL